MQKPMLGEMIDWSDPINQGLVLLLRLNEGMGDHVSDLSLNDNHGTLHGMAHPGIKTSGWTPGFRGKTLAFDGVDNYISASGFDNWTAQTISIWFKTPGSATGYARLIEKGFNNEWTITFNDAAYNHKLIVQVNSSVSDLISTDDMDDDVWHHAVVVINQTYYTSLYIDGIFDSGVQIIGTPPKTGDINIGGSFGNLGITALNGSIDEVRIYNRALLSSEITRLYMEGMPSKSTTHA